MNDAIKKESIAITLDLLAAVREQEDFLSASLCICDELKSSFFCDQVSLGWEQKGYIRLKAISGRKSQEPEMELTRLLEASMEECFQSETEIEIPGPEQLVYNHHQLAAMSGYGFSYSLSLNDTNNKSGGVLLLQRKSKGFSNEEKTALRIAVENIFPYLQVLELKEKPVYLKIFSWLDNRMRSFFSLEQPLKVLFHMGLFLLVMFLVFGRLEYRVVAPFVIRSSSSAVISPASDGILQEVYFNSGDRVKKGEILADMDSMELKIRRQEILSDVFRYKGEVTTSEAKEDYGQMMIAKAQLAQSESLLRALEYKIESCSLKAPVTGIISDDFDSKKRMGSQITRDEVLFKVDSLSDRHVEIEFSEKDLQYISLRVTGNLRFFSEPDKKYSFEINRLSPCVTEGREGGILLAQAAFKEQWPDWVRPGMTGMAKVPAGVKSPLWILSHRVSEWLAMRLFW
jgi:hypothetical protein